MKVVICEDNQRFASQMAHYIEKYTFIQENGIEIVLNSGNPFEILEYISHNHVDCFFLDIDLETTINGLDLAMEIRKCHPFASIVFVTTYNEMLELTFKYRVEALDFISKEEITDLRENIIIALETAYSKYKKIGQQKSIRIFQFKNGEFVKNIDCSDIIAFQVSKSAHKVILSTFNGQFEFYQSLNKIEEHDEGFFRCHKAYIINIENVENIDIKLRKVRMKNGMDYPVAFRRLKSLENAVSQKV